MRNSVVFSSCNSGKLEPPNASKIPSDFTRRKHFTSLLAGLSLGEVPRFVLVAISHRPLRADHSTGPIATFPSLI